MEDERSTFLKEKEHATNYQCTRSAKQKDFLFSAGGTPSVVQSANSLQEGKCIKMLFASGVITCAILLHSESTDESKFFLSFFLFSLSLCSDVFYGGWNIHVETSNVSTLSAERLSWLFI